MVVSMRHTNSMWGYYHEKWKDFLNIKDVCVIWGGNIQSEIYKFIKFNSASWTCRVEFPDRKLQSKFNDSCLSNNHILSDDAGINKEIMRIRKGDQIYIKGYLVEYSHSDGEFRRKTSTSRTDRDCEVIYVTELKNLKRANPAWNLLNTYAKYMAAGSLILLFLSLFKSVRGNRKKAVNRNTKGFKA